MLIRCMGDLSRAQRTRFQAFEKKLAKELKDLRINFNEEEIELRNKHEREFVGALENVTQLASGE